MINFEDFYDQQVDRIYNYCCYKTNNRFVAEDIASTVFLKFFKSKWQKLDKPVAYLYKICHNELVNYYKQQGKTCSLETLCDNGQDPSIDLNLENRALVRQILEQISQLPEDQRDVLLMQYVQDLDNKTIGHVLNKSESAVKSLAHRGLETIREKVDPKQSDQ